VFKERGNAEIVAVIKVKVPISLCIRLLYSNSPLSVNLWERT